LAAKPKLDAIADALDMSTDESTSYLDRETGEILVVLHEFLRDAEEGAEPRQDLWAWQVEALAEARKVVENPDQFVILPDRFGINEYSIMNDFCDSVRKPSLASELRNSIGGKGRFRRFKAVLYRHKMLDSWYEFRAKALREAAKGWCEENHIEYDEPS
jgi:hypothetical protein